MSESNVKILVVDDEPQIQKMLQVSLSAHHYQVSTAETGQEGITLAALLSPDLIVLDLGLPDIDGQEVVRRLREWCNTPIIILTAHSQEDEKIQTLDAGADDYLTKPFSLAELLARIRVCLRRTSAKEGEPVVHIGDLTIDLVQRKVLICEQEIKLTPTEYDILRMLAQYHGKVLTHHQLLKEVWGDAYANDTHYIRVYVGQLRRKIEENPARPRYILTESGVGYRLAAQ